MVVFLTIHARYKDVQWGIFKDGMLIEAAADESKKVSKNFLVMLGNLFSKHECSLSDLSFIAAHRGPAPLTTLRLSLATVNGLAFAQGTPLIGVNGLEGILDEHNQPHRVTVALLNAFGNDLYYGIDDPLAVQKSSSCFLHSPQEEHASSQSRRFYGRASAESFLAHLARDYTTPLSLVGNGVEVYKDLIDRYLGEQAHVLSTSIVSLETLAHKALADWNAGNTKKELLPLSLESTSFKLLE